MNDYYRIDQQGQDARWRVWWIGPLGFVCSLPFDSREQAERWVEFMESLQTTSTFVSYTIAAHYEPKEDQGEQPNGND